MSIITICVLAGGKGRRIGGEKWRLKLKGRRLINCAVNIAKETAKKVAAEIIIASGENDIKIRGIEAVRDIKGEGPIAGLYVALLRSERALIFPCDMPFLTPELLSFLLKKSSGYDITTFIVKGKIQPLVGVYSNKCLPYLERKIEKGEFSLFELVRYKELKVNLIAESELLTQNSELRTRFFFNINTKEDLAKAEEMLR